MQPAHFGSSFRLQNVKRGKQPTTTRRRLWFKTQDERRTTMDWRFVVASESVPRLCPPGWKSTTTRTLSWQKTARIHQQCHVIDVSVARPVPWYTTCCKHFWHCQKMAVVQPTTTSKAEKVLMTMTTAQQFGNSWTRSLTTTTTRIVVPCFRPPLRNNMWHCLMPNNGVVNTFTNWDAIPLPVWWSFCLAEDMPPSHTCINVCIVKKSLQHAIISICIFKRIIPTSPPPTTILR